MLDFDTFSRSVSKQLRRPLQLVTEVVDSRQNRERFYQKYCQIIIDINVLYKTDKTLSDLSEDELEEDSISKREGLYVLEQLRKNKIYLSFVGSNLNTVISHPEVLRYFRPYSRMYYAAEFDDLKQQIDNLASNKFANPQIAREVKRINSLYADYFGWGAQELSPNKFKISLIKSSANALFTLIVQLFNKRRAVLPKKDLFSYANNLYDLIVQLNYDLRTQTSQRERRRGSVSTITADVKRCTVYSDSNVLVLEPKRLISGPGDEGGLRRAAEMSHYYFGINRKSFVTSDKTVPGTNWCVSVEPDYISSHQPGSMFFIKRYLFEQGYNLYYFVDLSRDSVYALRTMGSGGRSASAENPNVVEKRKEIVDFLRRIERMKPLQDPMSSFRYLATTSTVEIGNGVNGPVALSLMNLLEKVGLTIEWAYKHIKFFEPASTEGVKLIEIGTRSSDNNTAATPEELNLI